MKCGCNKNKDGIDTDVLFDLPQIMFDSISSKIGVKKGTKYNDDIKKMLKEDAKLNNKNLRDYLTENPDVSKQITIIEMKKQGGILQYQKGKTLNVGYGNINPPQVPLKKDVSYDEMTGLEKDVYMNRPAVKPAKTEDGFYDEGKTTNQLINTLFPTGYDKEKQELFLNEFMEGNPEVAERITQGSFTDKDVNLIKLNFDKFKSKKPKYQVGGQIQNIINSGNDMNRLNQAKMYSDLQAPVTGMQKGGQVNDQKEFIKWLAQQLGVNSEEEFKAAVAQMGEQGLKQAQQMFKQQKGKQQGGMFKAKKGGILKYQKAGKFKSFADKEIVKTSNNKARYIPGTYDTNVGANTYGRVKSSKEFDATTQNAQSKIDYTQGVGQRTQSGLEGNRGTEGINLTDRLAKERADLQKNFNTTYNTPEFKKRIIVGNDGKKYVTDSTGKYNLGLYEERPNVPDGIPTKLKSNKLESKQDTAVVLGNSPRSKNKSSITVLTKTKESPEYTVNAALTEKLGHTFAKDQFLTDNRLKANVDKGKVVEYKGLDRSFYGNDTIPVTLSNNKLLIKK
jgi:hypothetical protein